MLTDAYRDVIRHSGIDQRIMYEFSRFPIENLRWEEIWDISLRIRCLFLKTDIPVAIEREISQLIEQGAIKQFVVRSSSPSEDTGEFTFAGLHESYINIVGVEDVLVAIKKVWASLWSDRALLYRKEMDLDPMSSTMAVLIQEFIRGERSGVAFTKSPQNPDHMIVESVEGLNQALVDGKSEPDRIVVRRTDQKIVSSTESKDTSKSIQKKNVKSFEQETWLKHLFESMVSIEREFKAAQDIEWTVEKGTLWILQARTITTINEGVHDKQWKEDDKRPWYLSLTRSYDNLKTLEDTIKDHILPGMDRDAATLHSVDLSVLTTDGVVLEIEKRKAIMDKWVDTYWEYCIPFAHGVRLFATFYNENIHSTDPFEFLTLLEDTELISVERNTLLEGLIEDASTDAKIKKALNGKYIDELPRRYLQRINALYREFGTLSYKGYTFFNSIDELVDFINKHSDVAFKKNLKVPSDGKQVEEFIHTLPKDKREFGCNLLRLARESYKLRDNDNIYLGKIEREVVRAVDEAKSRLRSLDPSSADYTSLHAVVNVQESESSARKATKHSDEPLEFTGFHDTIPDVETEIGTMHLEIRQLVGSSASQGIAEGRAFVFEKGEDIKKIHNGDILVCDSIDPSMTIVIPIVSAIVERRGGMLVHGAIIAREYGIPCVTGIEHATQLIKTGDELTVDGFLGIVTRHS